MTAACFQRQTVRPRLVYQQVSPPPPAAAPADAESVLVIQEPPPATVAPPMTQTPVLPPPPVVVPRQPHQRSAGHDTDDAPAQTNAAAPNRFTEAPPLVSITEPVSDAGVHAQLQKLNDEMEHLRNGFSLSPTERRTLEDARTFLRQSEQALADHDVLRANELAKKAALLLAAVGPER